MKLYSIDDTLKFWEATRINGVSASMTDSTGVDHRLVNAFDMVRDMVIKHPLQSIDSAPKDARQVMWVYEDTPESPGWYATNHSWDSGEGSFIFATFFDGAKWIPDRPVCAYAGPFQTEEQAEKFGEENAISW